MGHSAAVKATHIGMSTEIAHMAFGRHIYKGEYRGTKDSFRNVTVEVTMASGSVTEIRVTGGGLATTALRRGLSINDLFDEVIKAQSLQVDVISGATVTSNAHLKAVENALKQAESR